MSRITGHPPVKKALQKTVYLIEKKGVDLGFKYILHFYGPYCSALDHETAILNAEGIISFNYSQFGHKMNITSGYENIKSDGLVKDQIDTIKTVISRYKNATASDLELLTTALYAYEYTGAKTREAVRDNVKIIKGEKYNDAEIAWALNEFSFFNIYF
jgi:hypothetical protein